MLASGHVVVVTEGGDLALVRATPDRYVELARVPALDGRTWNHPAMADGYLLIRNASEMAAFVTMVRERLPASRSGGAPPRWSGS